jgi:hypothetical protein
MVKTGTKNSSPLQIKAHSNSTSEVKKAYIITGPHLMRLTTTKAWNWKTTFAEAIHDEAPVDFPAHWTATTKPY